MRRIPLQRWMWPGVALALAVVTVLAVLERLGDDARASARQALLMRAATLAQSALVPGSFLPCVDGTAGGDVDKACARAIFASPQSAAAAVAYMGARIDLLAQAYAMARRGDDRILPAMDSTRRAVARDRYGIAAHVLAAREGCTADKCALFAALDHPDVLKANLKADTFARYVTRYVAGWHMPGVNAAGPAVAKLTPQPALKPDTKSQARAPDVAALPAATPAPVASLAPPAVTALTPMPRPRHVPGETEPGTQNQPVQQAAPAPVSPPATVTARAEVPPGFPPPSHKPVPARWHFPSADSIPAISIMTPEPKLPKPEAEALARDTARKTAIERRMEGKTADGASAEHTKAAQKKSDRKKEAGKKPDEPGAPLQLTR